MISKIQKSILRRHGKHVDFKVTNQLVRTEIGMIKRSDESLRGLGREACNDAQRMQ